MKAALCVSGDFAPARRAITAASVHLLPTEMVDVFVYLWATPGTSENAIRNWMAPQLSERVRLKRWAFEPIRVTNEWTKFANNFPKYAPEYFEEMTRIESGLQAVSQLKCQQESIDQRDYDIVVQIDSRLSITAAPPAALFKSILEDHVVLGRFDIMPWFPAYEYGVSILSTRNMEIYAGIQTLHRRQYLPRYNKADLKAAMVHHFDQARLKTCSVLMQGGFQ